MPVSTYLAKRSENSTPVKTETVDVRYAEAEDIVDRIVERAREMPRDVLCRLFHCETVDGKMLSWLLVECAEAPVGKYGNGAALGNESWRSPRPQREVANLMKRSGYSRYVVTPRTSNGTGITDALQQTERARRDR